MSDQPRIVYADSDLESCRFLETLLTGLYQLPTTAVTDPTLVLELSAHNPFDLYILDYCFPETTAVEVCRSLRALQVHSPIVVYSALDRDIDRRLAAEAGAELFFSKPDDLPRLGPEIFRLLNFGPVARSPWPDHPKISTNGRISESSRFKLPRKSSGIL